MIALRGQTDAGTTSCAGWLRSFPVGMFLRRRASISKRQSVHQSFREHYDHGRASTWVTTSPLRAKRARGWGDPHRIALKAAGGWRIGRRLDRGRRFPMESPIRGWTRSRAVMGFQPQRFSPPTAFQAPVGEERDASRGARLSRRRPRRRHRKRTRPRKRGSGHRRRRAGRNPARRSQRTKRRTRLPPKRTKPPRRRKSQTSQGN